MLFLAHEGVTNCASLSDFDKLSVNNLPIFYNNSIIAIEEDISEIITVEASVYGASISLITANSLIASFNAKKHYISIVRATNPQNMGHSSVLATFKIAHDVCLFVNDGDDSKVPNIDEKRQRSKDHSLVSRLQALPLTLTWITRTINLFLLLRHDCSR